MIAEELGQSGLCVCPHFLSMTSVNEARADIEDIQAQGLFHRAGIGQGMSPTVQDSIRRDETHWFDRPTEQKPTNSIQSLLWNQVDLLQQAFNRTLFLGLRDFEGHYASYPVGGFYEKHRDNFREQNARRVSVVIYLNQDWQKQDGGELRVYSQHSHSDVEPRGGTLVCFMSEDSEHEVLLSHAPRHSFAGWFKTE